ncbi:hypothetical protein DL89DRAFT_266818, partial [Linderina pennispora]
MPLVLVATWVFNLVVLLLHFGLANSSWNQMCSKSFKKRYLSDMGLPLMPRG